MDLLVQLLTFIVTILLLVSIHETGHFLVAKALGIKVIRFAVGFGKPIYRHYSRQGTEYVVGLIPLGGYVKLLDEREMVVPDDEKASAFNRQPLWARTLVVIAGPFTNFIFAIFCFWLMYMIGVEALRPEIGAVQPGSIAAQAGLQAGDQVISVDQQATPSLQKVVLQIIKRLGEKTSLEITTQPINSAQTQAHRLNLATWSVNKLTPDALTSLGIIPPRPALPAIIQSLEQNGPAEKAGLKPGDRIVAINDRPVQDWYGFIEIIQQSPGARITVAFERGSQLKSTQVVTETNYKLGGAKVGHLGVQTTVVALPDSMKLLRQYPPLRALRVAAEDTWQYFVFNAVVIKKMFLGQISVGTLGGPIAIFQSAGLAFRQGISVFLGFLGLISVMLAFLNVLPIPGLDGGHLFNYLIELIIRRPLPLQYEIMSVRIGFFLLLLLMITATFNDLLRLFLS